MVGSSSRLNRIKGKASRSPVDATVDVAFSVSPSESSFRSAQEGRCDLDILRAATVAISVNVFEPVPQKYFTHFIRTSIEIGCSKFLWTN